MNTITQRIHLARERVETMHPLVRCDWLRRPPTWRDGFPGATPASH
jgi:hypothetical protein